MEHSSSSSRGYVDTNRSLSNDLSRSWSRPTLNTSLNNNPISPDLSPIPPHSPWHNNLSGHYLLPEMPPRNSIQASSPGMPPFNSDWEHLLVLPTHDSYPTLGHNNNGFSHVASHSLPGSYQSHYQSNVNPTSHHPSGSWSQSQSPIHHKSPSRYSVKQSLPRSISSSELKPAKGMSHSTPILFHLFSRLDRSRS